MKPLPFNLTVNDAENPGRYVSVIEDYFFLSLSSFLSCFLSILSNWP